MKGIWLMTWHEDREINPGVPDISYVMNGGNHETGWLELKATRSMPNKADEFRFKIEASQHQWIEAHHRKVPVHFLLRTPLYIWLFPGQHHKLLAAPITVNTLMNLSAATMSPRNTRMTLYEYLRQFTDRRRHD